MEKTVDADIEFMTRACLTGILVPEQREMRMSKARTSVMDLRRQILFPRSSL